MSNESVREMWAERWGRREPKIVCVGLNYAAHAEEQGTERPKAPVLFGKFANTMLWDGDPIVLGPGVGHVDSEAELALVIGRTARHVSEQEALSCVFGYTGLFDITMRGGEDRSGA